MSFYFLIVEIVIITIFLNCSTMSKVDSFSTAGIHVNGRTYKSISEIGLLNSAIWLTNVYCSEQEMICSKRVIIDFLRYLMRYDLRLVDKFLIDKSKCVTIYV